MRCIAPACNIDSRCASTVESVAFIRFPTEPILRQTWLMSLDKKNWQLTEDHAVCSKHFEKDDLSMSKDGQWTVRDGVLPVIYAPNSHQSGDIITSRPIKVCRICFAIDCNLYSMTTCKNLDQAYKILTGLPIANNPDLPVYLCTECSHRLLNCIKFRAKSIQANLILQEIIQKNKSLTVDAIKSCNGYQLHSSKLSISKKIDHYDLELKHVNMGDQDNINAGTKLYDVDLIKVERIKIDHGNFEDQNTDFSSVYSPKLHEVILPGIKLEKDDLYLPENLNHRDEIDNHIEDSPTLQDFSSVEVKLETIEMPEKDAVKLDDIKLGEDYSSEKDLSLRDQKLGDNLVRKESNAPIYFNEMTSNQHWEPLSESANMFIVNDKIPTEIQDESKSLKNVNTKDEVKPFDIKNKSLENNRKRGLKNEGTKASKEKPKHLCHICNKSYAQKQKLQLHLNNHLGVKPFSCEVCKKAFVEKHMLSTHKRVHSGEKPYKCSVCDKSFSQKGNVSKHMKVHSGEKPFSCSVCVKTFAQKCNLDKHFKTHSDEKPYSCELCAKAFKQHAHLETHMRTHSGEKPFSCNVCHKHFSIKSNLNIHLKIHTGEKRYSCPYCNKGFNENNRFQTHMRRHSGEKPFACNLCDKTFGAKSCLQSHLKVHSDEKPYVCNVCEKGFRHRNRLVTHLTTHT